MHILLTRPLEDCKDLIIKFKSLGHKVSHLPVIKIQKIDYEEPNFNDRDYIINPELPPATEPLDLSNNAFINNIAHQAHSVYISGFTGIETLTFAKNSLNPDINISLVRIIIAAITS